MVKTQTYVSTQMTYEYIWVTHGWHTSTYEWHTNDIRVHAGDIRMAYEYIRMTYEYMRVIYGWRMSTYEYHTDGSFNVLSFFLLKILNKMRYSVLILIIDDVINCKIYLRSSCKAMAGGEKMRRRQKDKNLNISRTKKAF